MDGYHDQYQAIEPKYVYIKDVLDENGEIDDFKLNGKVLVVKYLNYKPTSREKYSCSDIELFDDDGKEINLKYGNFKIFVTEKLRDCGNRGWWDSKKTTTVLMPKLFACNLSFLCLHDQNISYNDFLMLVSSGTLIEIQFITTEVLDKNKEMVPLEKLCKHLLNIEELHMQYTADEGTVESIRYKFNTTDETAQALLDLPCFKKLKVFSLSNVPFEKCFKTFAKFMKKHAFAKFEIVFLSIRDGWNITEEKRAQLQKIKEELIETWPTNDKPQITV